MRSAGAKLATTDVERARPFFGDLLGWEYETDARGSVLVRNVGRLSGGMREQTELERRTAPASLLYFTVGSADDAARQAARLGGLRLLPITQTPSGRDAVIADPQGAPFAVHEGQTDP